MTIRNEYFTCIVWRVFFLSNNGGNWHAFKVFGCIANGENLCTQVNFLMCDWQERHALWHAFKL
ncbi:hypothetical protein WL1483_2983 [Aeromonas schubertii]|uniref:Uncharacterized protein n=1 Tax=Aeromonas schubertii TaxID=652 RepID=A0A0S2SL88_9GAMM|nr:hypothetical protein WL1483_2983 [Aeromonas schubertii]